MLKIVAILNLCIHLCIASDAYQLCKLPKLVAHYQEHLSTQPRSTLLSFLQDHYVSKTDASSKASHEQLPFIDDDCDAVIDLLTTAVLCVPPQTELCPQTTPALVFWHQACPTGIKPSVFEPPRA